MLIETDREKEIQIGVSYPFEALGPGQCLANQNLRLDIQNAVQINEVISMNMKMGDLFNAMITDFNE